MGRGHTWRISYSAIMRTTAAFWEGEERQMTTLPHCAPTAASSCSASVPRIWPSVPPSITSSPTCSGVSTSAAPSADIPHLLRQYSFQANVPSSSRQREKKLFCM